MKGRSRKEVAPADPKTPQRQATTSEDRLGRIEGRLEDSSIWLSQRLIAELYQVSVQTVSEHISHIYEELDPVSTVRKLRTVQLERTRQVPWLIEGGCDS